MARERGQLRRKRMLRLLEQKGIVDRRVLEAMSEVPRDLFVPDNLHTQAYRDAALPIGLGQTISQPYVVARMTELLDVDQEHSVLEIGTGSGYQAAILAQLAKRVFSLERIPELAREAVERLRKLGLDNVKVHVFDGTVGWSEMAPFDRILVTAGAPRAPEALLEQLTERGRLVVPEGDRESQQLVVYDRSEDSIERQAGELVTFVPLIGRGGWDVDEV